MDFSFDIIWVLNILMQHEHAEGQLFDSAKGVLVGSSVLAGSNCEHVVNHSRC